MKGLGYFEENGELYFRFEGNIERRGIDYSEKIPKEIIKLGKKGIRLYAEQKVTEHVAKKTLLFEKIDKFKENPDFLVETKHNGKTLKGRIISAQNNTLVVKLEKPYQGERKVHYNFASAISGKYILSKSDLEKGNIVFSEDAINSAKELLIRIYNEKKHYKENKTLINLAEKLNESEGASR